MNAFEWGLLIIALSGLVTYAGVVIYIVRKRGIKKKVKKKG